MKFPISPRGYVPVALALIGFSLATTLAIGGPMAGSSDATPSLLAALPLTAGAEVQLGPQRLIPATPAEATSFVYVRQPDPQPPARRVLPTPVALARTGSGTFTIPVPVYRQTMVLDCETGAMQMGLAYYGHYYSQSYLFSLENADVRAPIMGPNHTVLQWGDPYTNFVGQVNGSDWIPTGYGVYYPVILSIARSHGAPNSYGGEGYSPSTVYAALRGGHPVEVWIETNWVRPWTGLWTAWDGRRVRYSYVEHAVILTGVSPTMVRVNEPLHGTQYWVSKTLFETVWRDFNNMAVVFAG